MKKYTIYIIFIVGITTVSSEVYAQFNPSFLSGSTSKNWNITDNEPKDSLASCNFPNSYSADNVWNFGYDHSFFFNPGLILVESSDPYCKDWSKISGNWTIVDDTLNLQIVLANDIQVFTTVKYMLVELNSNSFKISVMNRGYNQVLIFTIKD
jgi:hypothetical protein